MTHIIHHNSQINRIRNKTTDNIYRKKCISTRISKYKFIEYLMNYIERNEPVCKHEKRTTIKDFTSKTIHTIGKGSSNYG